VEQVMGEVPDAGELAVIEGVDIQGSDDDDK
jgi:hypothetical protein